jgi:hypothetical protein
MRALAREISRLKMVVRFRPAVNNGLWHYMRVVVIFAVILLLVRTSWGDGGAIQFQGDTESLHVTIFTFPPDLSAGPVDITVLVQDRTRLDPLLDATATLDLTPQNSNGLKQAAWTPPACVIPSSLSGIPAKLGHGENRLLYGALVEIPYNGIWNLKISIRRYSKIESVSTILHVNQPAAPPLAYWHLFILPPLGVLCFVLNQRARRQRRN